jgi:segregation and condensation protein A
VSPQRLALIAQRAFHAKRDTVDIDHLEMDLPSVDDAIRDLRVRLRAELEAEFGDLVEHCTRPMEIIAYFLALLELARWGVVKVSQTEPHATIAIAYEPDAPPSAQAMASEWSI